MTSDTKTAEKKELAEKPDLYIVTCGTYKEKKGALQEAVKAKKMGISVTLTVGKAGYTLLHAKGVSKEKAEEARKKIKGKGMWAEICQ